MDFASLSRSDISHLTAPVGFSRNAAVESVDEKGVDPGLVSKRSWDIALGPVKQLPMNLFIMWMAGNTISIFPIMMVGMMFVKPIQAIIQWKQTFKTIEGDQAALQKLCYILGNIGGLLLAMYKCQVMGLLPTHSSDWLAFAEAPRRIEFLGGGVNL